MVRLFGVRVLAVVVAGSIVALAVTLTWRAAADRHASAAAPPIPAAAATDDSGRDHALRFFKSAYDRIDRELTERPDSPAIPSLRDEQAAVLQKIKEIAGATPPDHLPPEIRALIVSPPVPARPAEVATGSSAVPEPRAQPAPEPPPPSVTLAAGLQPHPPAPDFSLPWNPALAAPLDPPRRVRAPKKEAEPQPAATVGAPANPPAKAAEAR